MNYLEQFTKGRKPNLEQERVLITDDLEKWLDVATDNLVYYGCKKENISRVDNVEEGKEIYGLKKPSLVFTDINFDVNNSEDVQGLDLIRYLILSTPIGRNRKESIVTMTSLKGDIRKRAFSSGTDYFIDKEDFVQEMERFVERYVRDMAIKEHNQVY